MAAWQHRSERVQGAVKKRARFTSLSPEKKKIDAFSLPPAHQLLLVPTAIEKLTSSKQNKWQNATKGGEWRRPNGVVFKEALPVGPLPPKQGKAEKGDLDMAPC